MKRFCLLACYFCCSGVADAKICMADYSILIVLDKDADGVVKYGVPSIDGMNWRIDVNYDTLATMYGAQRNIRGIVSCSEFAGGGDMYDVNTSGIVVAGDNSGKNCWCSMLRPATTYPMFVRVYDDVDACVSNCARLCTDSLIESYVFRDNFFEAVW